MNGIMESEHEYHVLGNGEALHYAECKEHGTAWSFDDGDHECPDCLYRRHGGVAA